MTKKISLIIPAKNEVESLETVLLEVKNTTTKLMKDLEYGKNYQYSHDFNEHFIEQNYFPEIYKK